jgi:hypothetical protein
MATPGRSVSRRVPGEEVPMRTYLTIPAMVALVATGSQAVHAQVNQRAVGSISGVVLGSGGHPLANQRVELELPDNGHRGRLVTATNESGAFAFTSLSLGRYQAEWRIRGEIVAREDVEISQSTMQVDDLRLALPDAKFFVDSLGTDQNARVDVELLDGTRVTGYVRATDDDSLTVTDQNRFQSRTVLYDDILSVSKGRSEVAALLIWLGVAFGVAAAGIAIAVTVAGGV